MIFTLARLISRDLSKVLPTDALHSGLLARNFPTLHSLSVDQFFCKLWDSFGNILAQPKVRQMCTLGFSALSSLTPTFITLMSFVSARNKWEYVSEIFLFILPFRHHSFLKIIDQFFYFCHSFFPYTSLD